MTRADLHVHSSASDGTDPPAEVVRRAAQAGLDVVALTDHDTVAGQAEARAALPPGLTLLPGMELSAKLDDRSVHLLAYLFDPDQPELAAELARIRDDRVIRARGMVDKLAALGVDISWDQVAAIAGPAVVGRPHIARAMAAAGAIAEPSQAFTPDWIADGGRAYVDRYALEPVRAISLVRAAGGVTALAHPRSGGEYTVSDEEITRLAAAGLAGRRGPPPRSFTGRTGGAIRPRSPPRPGRDGRQRRPRQPHRLPDRRRGRPGRRLRGPGRLGPVRKHLAFTPLLATKAPLSCVFLKWLIVLS